MRVLVACEFSGVVREAFRRRGHDAWSCDLIPTLRPSPYHHVGDVRQWAHTKPWDLVIAHPVCKFLTNSGVKHLYKGGKKINGRDELRWASMREGADFLLWFLDGPWEMVCVENPIMHGHAKDYCLNERGFDLDAIDQQILHPWEFGHPESKATRIWRRNLPKLQPTKNVYDLMMRLPANQRNRVHYESPGVKNGLTREQRRSIFFEGWADAMAEQWGGLR